MKSPARITSHTRSLIDVIIVNNTNDEMIREVTLIMAQFLYVKTKKLLKDPIATYNRHFMDNVEEC